MRNGQSRRDLTCAPAPLKSVVLGRNRGEHEGAEVLHDRRRWAESAVVRPMLAQAQSALQPADRPLDPEGHRRCGRRSRGTGRDAAAGAHRHAVVGRGHRVRVPGALPARPDPVFRCRPRPVRVRRHCLRRPAWIHGPRLVPKLWLAPWGFPLMCGWCAPTFGQYAGCHDGRGRCPGVIPRAAGGQEWTCGCSAAGHPGRARPHRRRRRAMGT